MKSRLSPSVFAIAFCVSYVTVFALDAPLFRYYPLHGDFTWGRQVLTGAGPAMAWYGMLADSGIIAAVLAACISEHIMDKIVRNTIWLFACAAMLGCIFLLRQLFTGGSP